MARTETGKVAAMRAQRERQYEERLAAQEDPVWAALMKCEARIQLGLKAFVEAGQALQDIRSRRLYRATHKTFEEYCQDRWGWSASRGRQLIAAAAVGVSVAEALPGVTLPDERAAREVGRIKDPKERADVVRKAAKRGKLTAKAIREAVAPAEAGIGESERPANGPAASVGSICPTCGTRLQ